MFVVCVLMSVILGNVPVCCKCCLAILSLFWLISSLVEDLLGYEELLLSWLVSLFGKKLFLSCF